MKTLQDKHQNKDIMEERTRRGQFLVKEIKCEYIFTPEDFSEEQKMMRDSVKEIVDKEIWPNKNRFEAKDYAFTCLLYTSRCV